MRKLLVIAVAILAICSSACQREFLSDDNNPSTAVFLGADTGSVTILEHNTTTKRIRGTFNFLANTVFTHLPPNAQLTEGYFSVVYQ